MDIVILLFAVGLMIAPAVMASLEPAKEWAPRAIGSIPMRHRPVGR